MDSEKPGYCQEQEQGRLGTSEEEGFLALLAGGPGLGRGDQGARQKRNEENLGTREPWRARKLPEFCFFFQTLIIPQLSGLKIKSFFFFFFF